MANHSKIEWTDATWNPVVGCSVASTGCKNCYAMTRVAPRLANNPKTPHYHGTVEKTDKGKYVWTGKIGIADPKTFEKPLHWKKPRRIFVNSTSDLFHAAVPDDVIDSIFSIMARCPLHIFQILTKHPQRMREYIGNGFLPNVWLGVSVENQQFANERIPVLLQIPAAIRFVSAEPLLDKIDLTSFDKLDWIIAGGESGPKARPMHPDWVRDLRDQCEITATPFFFKQWGGKKSGKSKKGCFLDGREHLAFPEKEGN